MFERVGQFLDAGIDLLDARARLLLRDARRTVISLAAAALIFVVAVVIIALGVIALIAAANIWLASQIGWPPALAISGGLCCGAGLLAVAILRRKLNRSDSHSSAADKALQVEAERANAAMHEALHGPPRQPDAPSAPSPLQGIAAEATRFAMNHPELLVGLAFAVGSVLGIGRSMRLIGKAAAATGFLASTGRLVSSWSKLLEPLRDLVGGLGGQGRGAAAGRQ